MEKKPEQATGFAVLNELSQEGESDDFSFDDDWG